jgi:hypothetical protein
MRNKFLLVPVCQSFGQVLFAILTIGHHHCCLQEGLALHYVLSPKQA